jgi:hypothetical protein
MTPIEEGDLSEEYLMWIRYIREAVEMLSHGKTPKELPEGLRKYFSPLYGEGNDLIHQVAQQGVPEMQISRDDRLTERIFFRLCFADGYTLSFIIRSDGTISQSCWRKEV